MTCNLTCYCIILILLNCLRSVVSAPELWSKYEYKYSFKGPSLSQPGGTVPFWNVSYDAVPSAAQVRVVPSLKEKQGAIWSKYPFPYENWQVDISFRVNGRGMIGADGFVFWYTDAPSQKGPVFGSKDNWNGLGLIFDSFDNDGKKNNPYVSVIINDGTMSYNHDSDGEEQMLGGCRKFFRNRPYPVKARITYSNKHLLVLMTAGHSPTDDYEPCTAADNIDLPKGYYFGISAATGGLADDHDVYKFLTTSLHSKTPDEQETLTDPEIQRELEEQKRLEEEYEKTLKEFLKDQEMFKEEHPEKVKAPDYDPEDLFQGGSSEELRSIFEVQNKISEQINELKSTVVLVIERQHRITSRLEASRPPDVDLAKAHEVDDVAKAQRVINDAISELKSHVHFLKTTSVALDNTVARLKANGGVKRNNGDIASMNYESEVQMRNLQETLGLMQEDITALETKAKNPPQLSCPKRPPPTCVPMTGYIVVAVLQVIALLVYYSMRQSQEDSKKKFF